MLFKFKSRATGDLIMLEANGRHVLHIIGKDTSGKGIILPAEIPAAITALESAVALEEATLLASLQAAKNNAEVERSDAATDFVQLRQRVQPFLQMLKASNAADAEIVWGV